MINGLFGKNFLRRRFSQASKSTLDIKKSVLYQDDDYIVIDKGYGLSTFGQGSNKESIIKKLHFLNLHDHENANIVYKLHNHVGGCLLICTNKFVKNHSYENTFLALVYGRVEKEHNAEIKLRLKYLPNSRIMIPSNNYEHMRDLKMIKYDVISNSIMYEKHYYSLLKIFTNANNSKYIKPLLFYSLYTCIVGDNEYVGVWKNLKKNGFFVFRDIKGQVYKARQFLLKRITQISKNNELMLHLHCLNVTFQSTCNQVISISAPLPQHMRNTLSFLGSPSLIQNIEANVRDQNESSFLINKKANFFSHMEESNILDDATFAQNGKNIDTDENSKLYDMMQDEGRMECENEELLNVIYNKQNANKKGEKNKSQSRRGKLAKQVSKLTCSDAPIFLADVE
ncbi:hypothetical protein, conserved [Plasmodium gonderi]|uniref:Pseudouridine synthase n=1 Tax=Plasmodium gonderi TaxID=77519 RepID=A0A1Y1JB64_PLAGO|nr:hypothetical protein, conserved [Plasmodium gonderi]GAW79490.1 hypothetical protein, conserved [Plasmodium gonderi]